MYNGQIIWPRLVFTKEYGLGYLGKSDSKEKMFHNGEHNVVS
jgi:hypothetical protein